MYIQRIKCVIPKTFSKSISTMFAPRSLITISGKYKSSFLQSLITNNINILSTDQKSIHCYFLSTNGRILSESFIYNCETSEDQTFFLECPENLTENLLAHLQKYNFRKKLQIQLNNEFQSRVSIRDSVESNSLHKSADPRGPNGWSFREIIKKDLENDENLIYEEYESRRIKLCIPEYPHEVIPNKNFPFECNADLFGSISFDKGCYIGQELTARVKYTGVIRKRQLYFITNSEVNSLKDMINVDQMKICNQENVSIGVVKSSRFINNSTYLQGLALVNLTEVDKVQGSAKLVVEHLEYPIKLYAPRFWSNFPADIERI